VRAFASARMLYVVSRDLNTILLNLFVLYKRFWEETCLVSALQLSCRGRRRIRASSGEGTRNIMSMGINQAGHGIIRKDSKHEHVTNLSCQLELPSH
jgi:hypothetical protein